MSELRVTEKGVEVKLVDRVRALETLWKLLEASEPPAGRIRCYQALTELAGGNGETGMRNEMIRFSRKQRQVLTWWRQNRWQAIICDGAVRSGKTFCMGLSFFLWAQSCFRRTAVCPVRQDGGGAAAEFADGAGAPACGGSAWSVRENRSANTLTVEFGGQRNQFLLFGGKDESSAALIQGSTLAGLLLDEAALMPRSFVEQAVARCSVRGSKLWFNCNPEGPEHWFYKEWIEKAESRGALRLHFTMEDNPGLSPEIRQRYERLYTGVFYRRFVLGEWAAAQGLGI